MDKRQIEIEKITLDHEKKCLKDLQKAYTEALADVKEKLSVLLGRQEEAPTTSIAYQVQFQRQLEEQLQNALDTLKRGNVTSVDDFLNKTYEDSYLGTIYGIQGQGIPINIGIDHEQMARTINRKTDSFKFSERLYKNVDNLGVAFKSEMSRGIANNFGYSKIAKQLAMETEASYKQAMRIVRTEGGRVKSEAKLNSMKKAKDDGADIVKQWDATFDGKTRAEHRHLDGQIKEIDEPFIDSQGREAQAPHKFGVASMDINCRCIVVERARWAVEGEEMPNKVDNLTGELVEAKDYKEWKEKYQKQQVEQKKAEMPNNAKVFDKNSKELPSVGDYFKTTSNDLVKVKAVNDYNGIKSVELENGQNIVLNNAGELKTDIKPLTKNQQDAVEYYVSGDGMYLNDYLRDRNDPVERMGEMRVSDRRLIKDLDRATDRPLEPQTLYRSVDASAVFGEMSNMDYENLRGRVLYNDNSKFAVATDKYIDNAVGKTITDKGFISTTTDYEVARDFDGFTGSEKPIVLEIKTTNKTKGLSLAKEMPELNARMEQEEVLLQRNQKYKILSVSGKDGNIYVQAIMEDSDDIIENIVEERPKETHKIVEGKNIVSEWKRRNKFEYEIDDVIDYQGFNGKPRLVDEEEFNKLVKETGFYGERTYSTKSKAVLELYQQELYEGEFYVNCSNGGAMYGQGMYCASTDKPNSKIKLKGIAEEMNFYQELAEMDGKIYHKTEKITLDKSARIIKRDDIAEEYVKQNYKELGLTNEHIEAAAKEKELREIYNNAYKNIKWKEGEDFSKVAHLEKAWTEYSEKNKYYNEYLKIYRPIYDEIANSNDISMRNKPRQYDAGILASKMGYDAIQVRSIQYSDYYTIILNRTKVIFLKGGE